MDYRLATADDIPELVDAIRAAPRIALDTEFHAERRYLPRLYLVQLNVPGSGIWIVDPLQEPLFSSVGEALVRVPWLVHAGQQDVRLLHRAFGELPPRIDDTQIAAGLVDAVYPAGLDALLARFLGVGIDKAATMSDWSRRPLSATQLRYAAEDVARLPGLWEALNERARALGRTEALRQACAEDLASATEPVTPGDAWRSIGAVGVLTRQQAAVAQELAAWRERRAKAQDQPTRSILSDGLVVELARRQPLTLESMGANRRFPKAVLRRYGSDLLDMIDRTSRRPEWAWPHPIANGSPAARRRAWLESFAQADGRDRHYGARLLLSRSIIWRLATEVVEDRVALRELLGPWRDDLVGERLWAALNGELTLRLDADVAIADHPS